MPHEAESFKNRQNSFSGGPNRAKIPRNKPRTASSWNSDAPKGVVQAFHKLLIYLVLSDSIEIPSFCSAFIHQTIHFSIKVLGKDIEALIFILLGLALPMIGVSGSDELDDEQTDLGIEPPSNGPGEIEKLIDTWRPDDLSGRGNGDDYPMRIEGRNGSDTRHGHNGDQLVGGADVFTVVVGERHPHHLQQVGGYCYRWTVQTLTIPRCANLMRREKASDQQSPKSSRKRSI